MDITIEWTEEITEEHQTTVNVEDVIKAIGKSADFTEADIAAIRAGNFDSLQATSRGDFEHFLCERSHTRVSASVNDRWVTDVTEV